MKLAAAQLQSKSGDIQGNISKHIKLTKVAVEHNCDLIFFPELSLSNYEAENACDSAISVDDQNLQVFQTLSDENNIIICLGIPVKKDKALQIGQVIFQPQQARSLYAKQILHEDELPYFVAGEQSVYIGCDNNILAPAICYESMLMPHVEQAVSADANFYLASVAKNKEGVERGYVHYAKIAKQFGITVMMSNGLGPADNFVSFGCSAIWDEQGNCLASLDEKQSGIVVFDKANNTAYSTSIDL
ncbi:carbon-nitrogen hydrolase family protein [Agaribacter flavus]|uniref:Carbon-nitrogen hydrolase family protein n=1 Tax=Agaribacter flavus TaxID=1902781 RepID=A0ABV7FML8_9ALTE